MSLEMFRGSSFSAIAVEERALSHDRAQEESFLESPFVPVFEGRGGARRRLEGPDAVLDFPILRDLATSVLSERLAAPARLHQNYPNPFNPATTFRFDLKYADHVELAVFDATGRTVRHLVNGRREAGTNEVVWDGRSDRGEQVASGVYFYRLTTAGIVYSRPAVLIR